MSIGSTKPFLFLWNWSLEEHPTELFLLFLCNWITKETSSICLQVVMIRIKVRDVLKETDLSKNIRSLEARCEQWQPGNQVEEAANWITNKIRYAFGQPGMRSNPIGSHPLFYIQTGHEPWCPLFSHRQVRRPKNLDMSGSLNKEKAPTSTGWALLFYRLAAAKAQQTARRSQMVLLGPLVFLRAGDCGSAFFCFPYVSIHCHFYSYIEFYYVYIYIY